MRRVIALLLCLAVPCAAQESDAGTLIVEIDAGTPIITPEFPRDAPTSSSQLVVLSAEQARVVRDRIVSCEAERDTFRKATLIQPWQLVLISVAAAVVAGASVAVVYESQKPKP